MRKRLLLVAGALSLAAVACGGGSKEMGTKSGSPEVELKDISFKPAKVSVKVGVPVTWKFDDKGINHSVTADDGSFKSEVKDSGTFEHKFETAGTFSYKCSVHPDTMKGTVEVRA